MVPSQEVSSFRPASLTDILPSIPKKVRLPSRLRIYKRPEFEITFHKPTRTYFVGDIVRLKGQVGSFSGVKMANTEINYTISVSSPIFYFPRRDTTIHGITRSNALREISRLLLKPRIFRPIPLSATPISMK